MKNWTLIFESTTSDTHGTISVRATTIGNALKDIYGIFDWVAVQITSITLEEE